MDTPESSNEAAIQATSGSFWKNEPLWSGGRWVPTAAPEWFAPQGKPSRVNHSSAFFAKI